MLYRAEHGDLPADVEPPGKTLMPDEIRSGFAVLGPVKLSEKPSVRLRRLRDAGG